MIDADEGGMRDDVQRLRAAIFRMRPPADVGEQAGGMAVARLLSSVSSMSNAAKRFGRPVRPAHAHGVTERARSSASSSDAEISGSIRRSSSVSSEKRNPRARRARDDRDLGGLHRRDDLLQHHGAVGQQRAARSCDTPSMPLILSMSPRATFCRKAAELSMPIS